MTSPQPKPSWKQRPEGGGHFAIWLIRGIARHGGRRIARLLLGPITLYFMVVRGPERRASIQYLERVLRRTVAVHDVDLDVVQMDELTVVRHALHRQEPASDLDRLPHA